MSRGALRRIVLALAFAGLVAAAPSWANEPSSRILAVSASVVLRCSLGVSVPRVGTPQRSSGSGSFSVACTHGGIATSSWSKTTQPRLAATLVRDRLGLDSRRVDYRIETDVALPLTPEVNDGSSGIALAQDRRVKDDVMVASVMF